MKQNTTKWIVNLNKSLPHPVISDQSQNKVPIKVQSP